MAGRDIFLVYQLKQVSIYFVRRNPFQVASGKILLKDLEVRKELVCGNIIVKLYTPPLKQRYNRNIIGENIHGDILWQIDDVNPINDAPFTNIMLFDDEKIKASNWDGCYYYIHISDGKIEFIPNQRPW